MHHYSSEFILVLYATVANFYKTLHVGRLRLVFPFANATTFPDVCFLQGLQVVKSLLERHVVVACVSLECNQALNFVFQVQLWLCYLIGPHSQFPAVFCPNRRKTPSQLMHTNITNRLQWLFPANVVH